MADPPTVSRPKPYLCWVGGLRTPSSFTLQRRHASVFCSSASYMPWHPHRIPLARSLRWLPRCLWPRKAPLGSSITSTLGTGSTDPGQLLPGLVRCSKSPDTAPELPSITQNGNDSAREVSTNQKPGINLKRVHAKALR